jgi:hypothetical protein
METIQEWYALTVVVLTYKNVVPIEHKPLPTRDTDVWMRSVVSGSGIVRYLIVNNIRLWGFNGKT